MKKMYGQTTLKFENFICEYSRGLNSSSLKILKLYSLLYKSVSVWRLNVPGSEFGALCSAAPLSGHKGRHLNLPFLARQKNYMSKLKFATSILWVTQYIQPGRSYCICCVSFWNLQRVSTTEERSSRRLQFGKSQCSIKWPRVRAQIPNWNASRFCGC